MRALALVGAAVIMTAACNPAKAPIEREYIRGAIHVLTGAVGMSSQVCADGALLLKNAGNPEWEKISRTCSDGAGIANGALKIATEAVNSWDDASAGKIACAVSTAIGSLNDILDELALTGVHLRPDQEALVEDALKLASWIADAASGGQCSLPPSGSSA